jgi:putative membrane protein
MKNSMTNIAIASCFAFSISVAHADSQNSQSRDDNKTNETTSGGTWTGKAGSSRETGTSQNYGSNSSGSNDPRINNSGSSSSGSSQFGSGTESRGNSSNSGNSSSNKGSSDENNIRVILNKIDIENGALAKKSTTDKEVFDFASRMVKEHAEVLKQANDLIKKLNLHPDDSAISRNLATAGEQNLNKMKFFSETSFEKNYVNAEITLHQKFIDITDIHLIPNVKNEELQGMLVNVRHVLVSHLEHAQKIQSALGSKKK